MRTPVLSFAVLAVLTLSFLFAAGRGRADTGGALSPLKRGTTIYVGIDEDSSEWPPYEYFHRENGVKTKQMVGYSIDVLDEILSPYGLKYEFRVFPWKRVLANLASGEKIQLILPTSINEQRKATYLISHQAYSITPSYFYLKSKFPDGLAITEPGQLLEHGPVCGRLGFNYKNFGIENEDMTNVADNFKALIQMLKMERCSVVLARYEVLKGYSLLGLPLLTSDIGSAPMPGEPREGFYYVITKNWVFSNDLLQVINAGIDRLQSRGRLAEILKKHSK